MEYMAQSPIGNVLYKRRRDKMLCVRIDVHPCIPWKTPAKVKPDVMHACIYNTGKGPKKKEMRVHGNYANYRSREVQE